MKSRIKLDKRSRLFIPNEFQLKKYEDCEAWGIEEWSKAISHRVSLRSEWNRSIRKLFDIEDIEMVYGYFKTSSDRLIEEPLKYYENKNFSKPMRFINDQSVADLFEDAEDDRLLSSSWRADYLEWRLTPDLVLYELERDLHKNLVERVEKTPSWVMKSKELGQTGVATINVQMNGDSAEIVKEFRAWLKRTKNEMNLPKNYSSFDKKTLSYWCNDRVLPCFDLVLYKSIHNGWFSLKDMTEALFPVHMSDANKIKDEAQVKRTIIPNALRIVSTAVAVSLARTLKKEQ